MSEFVLFKQPQQSGISYWEGVFKDSINGHSLFESDTFILGEFNAGNEFICLVPTNKQTINIDDPLALDFELKVPSIVQTSQKEFLAMVLNIQHAIRTDSNLNKVVLARAELVLQKLDLLASFYSLCKTYPNGLVYMVSSQLYGSWIGASPEVFLSIQKNKFKTYALAGTKTSHQNWTVKEIEEQNWVTTYIENHFQELGIKYTKQPTETIQSGQLFHLKTTIEGTVQGPSVYNQIIQEMNPTPAVAGIEKQKAVALIRKEEKNKRSIYAGIVGPVFKDLSAQLYVNLRCLQAFTNAYCLYAGAGITAGSNPQDEWEETVKKMENTRRAVISYPLQH